MDQAKAIVSAGGGERKGAYAIEGSGLQDAGRLGEADGGVQPVQCLDFGGPGVMGKKELSALLRRVLMGD